MKKALLLANFLWLLPPDLRASTDFSLLFTRDEMEMIRERLHGGGDMQVTTTEITFNALYLSAIMFMDGRNWTLWLNDQVIRAGEFLDTLPFKIEKVTPLAVTFSWVPPQSLKRIFTLKSGQSYMVEKDTVVKGDQRKNLEEGK